MFVRGDAPAAAPPGSKNTGGPAHQTGGGTPKLTNGRLNAPPPRRVLPPSVPRQTRAPSSKNIGGPVHQPRSPTPKLTNGRLNAPPAQSSQALRSTLLRLLNESGARPLGTADIASGVSNLFRHSGGDGLLGTILGDTIGNFLPAPLAAAVTHPSWAVRIAKNTGRDLVELPYHTIQGAESLGSAAVHDVGQSWFHPFSGSKSQTLPLLDQMWKQSVIERLAHGDISGALHRAENHPLEAASEVGAGWGLVGRTAGSVGRSGLLGKGLASTARAPREVAPGLAPEIQHFSKNVGTKQFQKLVDRSPTLQGALERVGARPTTERLLKQRVWKFVDQATSRERARTHEVEQALHAEKPKSEAVANIVPYTLGIAGGRGNFRAALAQRLEELRATAAQERALTPHAAANNLQHQTDIEAALAHPNIEHAFDVGHGYAARQAEFQAEKAALGLRETEQMDQALRNRYALANMEGTHYLDQPITRPEWTAEYRAAAAQHRQALADQRKAELNLASLKGEHKNLDRQIVEAERTLAKTSKTQQRAVGFNIGRFGQGRTLSYKVPKDQQGRLLRSDITHTGAKTQLDALKQAISEHRSAQRADALEALNAAKDSVKDARDHLTLLKQTRDQHRVSGLMVEDPTAMPIPSGHHEGLRLRRLTNEEIDAHASLTRGEDPQAYFRMTTPMDELHGPRPLARGGSPSKHFTGASVKAGSWQPGWQALHNSQMADAYAIERAKTFDELAKRFAVARNLTPENAPFAAHEYETRTGIPVVPYYERPKGVNQEQAAKIADLQQAGQHEEALRLLNTATTEARVARPGDFQNERIMLIPKTVSDEYRKFLGDESIKLGPLKVKLGGVNPLGGPNQAFRNSVLPLNPRLLMMHVGEGGIRTGLGEGLLAPIKAPRDWMLAKRAVKEMPDDASRERLLNTIAPGRHAALSQRLNEDFSAGRSTRARTRLGTVLRDANDTWSKAVAPIYQLHRMIERQPQLVGLGMHARQTMLEWAGSWMELNRHMEELTKRVAEGYAHDPQLVDDAARTVHSIFGQYNAFSPQMKWIVSRVSPFLAWYVNAARFVYHTLPVDHPLAQAIALDARQATAQQWDEQAKHVPHESFFGIPVGPFVSSLPVPRGYIDVGRYSPEALTEGPVSLLTNLTLPAFGSSFRALLGQDPFGAPFKGPGGADTDTGHHLGYAANQFAESLGGPLAVAARVFENRGRTPYNTSTLVHPQMKPGTTRHGGGLLGGLVRTFNPFEVVPFGGKKGAAPLKGPGFKLIQPAGGGSKSKGGPGFKLVQPAAHNTRAQLAPASRRAVDAALEHVPFRFPFDPILHGFNAVPYSNPFLRPQPPPLFHIGPQGGLLQNPTGPDRLGRRPNMGEPDQMTATIPIPTHWHKPLGLTPASPAWRVQRERV